MLFVECYLCLVYCCLLYGVGCWLLVVGWLLVVRCWLSVVGCWLLVVGRLLFVRCAFFVVSSWFRFLAYARYVLLVVCGLFLVGFVWCVGVVICVCGFVV